MNVSCSPGFLLLVSALIYLDGPMLMLWVLSACVLHEAGHYIAAKAVGYKVHSLRLTAVGVEMNLMSAVPLSYWRDILVAFAGPCVNLIFAWASIWCDEYMFAGINLSLGLMNLLPVWPLDGARILLSIFNCISLGKTDQWLYILSFLFSGAFFGLGWAAWRGCGNLSLLCASAWLIALSIKGKK